MKFALLLRLTFPFAGQLLAADPAHALRQGGREVVFHYGVVPAQVVLAHPDKHPVRPS